MKSPYCGLHIECADSQKLNYGVGHLKRARVFITRLEFEILNLVFKLMLFTCNECSPLNRIVNQIVVSRTCHKHLRSVVTSNIDFVRGRECTGTFLLISLYLDLKIVDRPTLVGCNSNHERTSSFISHFPGSYAHVSAPIIEVNKQICISSKLDHLFLCTVYM